ncbi:hypothetical protein BUE80_DR009006 [Diplocarpon rosae]|nr:hypothetical protein BUE80_DR009006 [Diplocarpon rosae]
MPNWKSYESSVRLLSAIIAAHPQLKLNYDDVGRFYGDGAKYKSIWDRMKIINKNAEAIAAALEAGLDPFQVPLVDSMQAVKSKTPDLSTRFGGDCTKYAIENRFRRIKIDAKFINDAVKKGVDPITLPIGLDQVNPRSDIAACYGSDTTPGAIRGACDRHVIPVLKKLKACMASGRDPKDLAVDQLWLGGKNGKIAKRFGSHCTRGGLAAHFTRDIKPNATLLQAAFEQGIDPKEITLRPSGIAKCFGDGLKRYALSMRFTCKIRPASELILNTLARGEDPARTVPIVLLQNLTQTQASEQALPLFDTQLLLCLTIWLLTAAEMVKYFGSDVTPNALGIAVRRHFNPMAKRVKEFAESGHDCKDLKLIEDPKISSKAHFKFSFCLITCPLLVHTLTFSDLAKHFGSDTTAGALQKHYYRYYRDNVKAIRECVQAGRDPKDLTVNLEASDAQSGKETLKHFDSTMKIGTLRIGIQRNVTPFVKLVKDCARLGHNPMDLNLVVDAKDNAGKSGKQFKVEVAACFGYDASVSAVTWQLAVPVKNNIKAIFDARAKGIEVKDITLRAFAEKRVRHHDLPDAKKLKDVRSQGVDCQVGSLAILSGKPSKVQTVYASFRDNSQVHDKGIDRKDVNLPSLNKTGNDPNILFSFQLCGLRFRELSALLIITAEMASLMGSDVTRNGLRFQFTDRIRPIGNRLVEMRAAGEDAKDLDLSTLHSAKGSKTGDRKTARVMGSDVTPKALRHQIGGTIKAMGQKQLAMLVAGEDPKGLDLGTVKAGKAHCQNFVPYVYNTVSLHSQATGPGIVLNADKDKCFEKDSIKGSIEFKIRHQASLLATSLVENFMS